MERAPILRADVQAVGGDWASASGIEHAFLNHRQRAARAFLAGETSESFVALFMMMQALVGAASFAGSITQIWFMS